MAINLTTDELREVAEQLRQHNLIPIHRTIARTGRRMPIPIGPPFMAVVTACGRNDSNGNPQGDNLFLTVKKLTGLPFSFADGDEIEFVWAGINPPIVIDAMVLVFPIVPLVDNPEITHYAFSHIRIQPDMLDEPKADCIAVFGTSCDESFPSDPCTEAP